MTPTKAAKIIGCSAPHVRLLCRQKKLKAKRTAGENGAWHYDILRSSAEKYRDLNKSKRGRGRPRGPVTQKELSDV